MWGKILDNSQWEKVDMIVAMSEAEQQNTVLFRWEVRHCNGANNALS